MFLYFFKKKIIYIIKRAQYQDRATILQLFTIIFLDYTVYFCVDFLDNSYTVFHVLL